MANKSLVIFNISSKNVFLFSSFDQMLYQRQQKIFASSVPWNKVLDLRVQAFTELFLISCAKEETSLMEMELEESPYMAPSLGN